MIVLYRYKTICTLLALAFFSTANAQNKSYINPSSADSDGAPFSGAVMVDETLYLSGMIGLVDGEVPATAEEEARSLMEQFKATLEEAGMTMDDLVNITIYCSDVSHYDAFNSVYRTYFSANFPARAFIGSGALLFDARFEMQGIAIK
ncbi:MAG: RidA family protein [Gammaproteobacteria bacterium]|jgi:reactive intermediate/imine deaminase|nr:RidA family protein [Gammaproteobacteria bacterium]|tara:strand:- start:25 stop:468 length:444 start_codon:yes stop_codon:yes gene_type:complete